MVYVYVITTYTCIYSYYMHVIRSQCLVRNINIFDLFDLFDFLFYATFQNISLIERRSSIWRYKK